MRTIPYISYIGQLTLFPRYTLVKILAVVKSTASILYFI